MTPKEKAKEIVDKFYQTTPNEAWINEPLGIAEPFGSWKQARQCALIAVDEIIKSSPTYPWAKDVGAKAQGLYENVIFPTNYWRDVKSEILQL